LSVTQLLEVRFSASLLHALLQFVIGLRGWYRNSPKQLPNKAHDHGRANTNNNRTQNRSGKDIDSACCEFSYRSEDTNRLCGLHLPRNQDTKLSCQCS
jgi:hypothetical protein